VLLQQGRQTIREMHYWQMFIWTRLKYWRFLIAFCVIIVEVKSIRVTFNRALIEASIKDFLVYRYNLLYRLVAVALLFTGVVNYLPLLFREHACHSEPLPLTVSLFGVLSLA